MGDIIVKDPQEAYAETCYLIERDLHQVVDGEYSVARFLAQAELLKKDYQLSKRSVGRKK